MSARQSERRYRPTESKYKGGAKQMYVTYDLRQETRGGGTAVYPKVKRVYIAGDVKTWKVGTFSKRSGKRVHGVRIEYQQTRSSYHRQGFTAKRGRTTYQVGPAEVKGTVQTFWQIVEVPAKARNVRFHTEGLPAHYREARQDVA